MIRKITALTALIFCLSVGLVSASPVGRALNTYNYKRSTNTAVVYQITSNHQTSGGYYSGYTGKGVGTHYYGGENQFGDCNTGGSNPAAVPEPMSALLMLLGMGGAAALRRKINL